jgi:hypothetical protein
MVDTGKTRNENVPGKKDIINNNRPAKRMNKPYGPLPSTC